MSNESLLREKNNTRLIHFNFKLISVKLLCKCLFDLIIEGCSRRLLLLWEIVQSFHSLRIPLVPFHSNMENFQRRGFDNFMFSLKKQSVAEVLLEGNVRCFLSMKLSETSRDFSQKRIFSLFYLSIQRFIFFCHTSSSFVDYFNYIYFLLNSTSNLRWKCFK